MFRSLRHHKISFVFLTVAAFLLAPAAYANLKGPPKYSAIVVEAKSGEVMYARLADSDRYPASLTKIMTLYLAFDALESGKIKLSDKITISKKAARQPPSKLGLKAGRTITVDKAIRALAVKSSNDIAYAMAEFLGGSESRFAAIMTIRAKELGMKNTRFVNASGLPDVRQISTARDMAILSRAVMRDHPKYYGYFATPTFHWRGADLRNHNRLLHRKKGVDGIKTGFTNASGFNLAASAVKSGKRLIAVVIGGRTARTRDAHVEELLDKTFAVLERREKGKTFADMSASQMANVVWNDAEDPIAGLIPGVEQGSTDGYINSGYVGDYMDEYDTVQDKRIEDLDYGPSQYLPFALSSDEAGSDVLDMAVVAEPVPPISPLVAHPIDAPQKSATRGTKGTYSIQIGAFDTRAEALSKLRHMNKRHKSVVGHIQDSVTTTRKSGKTYHRVRFVGLSRQAAKETCQNLRKAKHSCLVLAGS